MKKSLVLVALSCAAILSADHYYQQPYGYDNYGNSYYGYGSCPNCQGYQGGYYQDGYYQGCQGQSYYQESYQQPYYQDYDQQTCCEDNNQQTCCEDHVQQLNDQDGKKIDKSANPDQEINKKIKNTLSSGWFSKGYEHVAFDVYNGNVTLRGTVNTQDDRKKVEDSVRKIDGVKQINNQIQVVEKQTAYNESKTQKIESKFPYDSASTELDRQLNSKIRDKISNGWFTTSYEAVILNTNNGIVTVIGTVDHVNDIQKINDKIKNIDGVKSVNNQLSVKNR